ncbi:MAG: RNA polymerase sigma factor [Oscillospiraceae bacterium]|jgi:RNA polymerase sigma-70 factor (ECF subfamily)|nr:RNA polymerase sigma factor [Oscillospiraceae bacterium]
MDYGSFCQLVEEHGSALYKFCRKLSPNDADDLYQETFLRVFQRLTLVEVNAGIKSYLFKACINLWRSSCRHNALLKLEAIDTALNIASPELLPLDAAINTELSAQVSDEIAKLPEKFRIPLLMHYTAQLSVEEIARAMFIPSGTVKSRLFKARNLIKARLENLGYE